MKRAIITTNHDHAHDIAEALKPDNTTEMTTRVENGTITTTITREATNGLKTTVDDYIVNLIVASTTTHNTHQTNYEQ